jgi:L-threonylcarbamoyladenylate synthase
LKRTGNLIAVDARQPDMELILLAAGIIHNGGVVVIPTSSLYGLAADAGNPEALARIFRIKGRDPGKPILVLIDRMAMLDRVAGEIASPVLQLMAHFWPGGVTFVVPARPGLSPILTSGSGAIGVRRVRHPVAAALVRAAGCPITGTSANLSGAPGCAAVEDIDPSVREAVDLVLDAGPLAGGPGSTVVDVAGTVPVILREGAVPGAQVLAAFAQIVGD